MEVNGYSQLSGKHHSSQSYFVFSRGKKLGVNCPFKLTCDLGCGNFR